MESRLRYIRLLHFPEIIYNDKQLLFPEPLEKDGSVSNIYSLTIEMFSRNKHCSQLAYNHKNHKIEDRT